MKARSTAKTMQEVAKAIQKAKERAYRMDMAQVPLLTANEARNIVAAVSLVITSEAQPNADLLLLENTLMCNIIISNWRKMQTIAPPLARNYQAGIAAMTAMISPFASPMTLYAQWAQQQWALQQFCTQNSVAAPPLGIQEGISSSSSCRPSSSSSFHQDVIVHPIVPPSQIQGYISPLSSSSLSSAPSLEPEKSACVEGASAATHGSTKRKYVEAIADPGKLKRSCNGL